MSALCPQSTTGNDGLNKHVSTLPQGFSKQGSAYLSKLFLIVRFMKKKKYQQILNNSHLYPHEMRPGPYRQKLKFPFFKDAFRHVWLKQAIFNQESSCEPWLRCVKKDNSTKQQAFYGCFPGLGLRPKVSVVRTKSGI